MPPSEDEISLGDDEFGVPEDPMEQERFKRRLIAIARRPKKKQQQLQDRRTEVWVAQEYGLEHRTKYYPKRRLLPQFEEEALKAKRQPTPHRRHTTARGYSQDQQHMLNNNIAGAPGTSAARNGVCKTRCNKYKHPKTKDNAQDTRVNTGARSPQPVQREKIPQNNNSGPSSLNRILDRPC